MSNLLNLATYLSTGSMFMGGMEPDGITSDNRSIRYSMGGVTAQLSRRASVINGPDGNPLMGPGSTMMGGALLGGIFGAFSDSGTFLGGAASGGALSAMSYGIGSRLQSFDSTGVPRSWRGAVNVLKGGAVNPLISAYTIYKGYQSDGFAGAKDALVQDIAISSAVAHFGYHIGPGSGGLSRTIVSKGMLSHVSRGLGAAVGSTIGGALGEASGIPGGSIAGTLIGAYAGAAPLKAFAAHPVIGGAMIAATGIAAVSYGSYQVLKMGQSYRQSKRSIDTSGDLASFMTQGAFSMRERAVQAMQRSHMNARNFLGQEAGLYSQNGYRTGRSYKGGY